jgi:hypothetical protein
LKSSYFAHRPVALEIEFAGKLDGTPGLGITAGVDWLID